MKSDTIRHPERLRQITDFSTFPLRGGDVDFETELTAGVVVRGEWKFEDAKLSGGQSQASYNWVNRTGQVAHAFLVVATHSVPTTEPITGEDLLVKTVLFRFPSMSRAIAVFYDEVHRPDLNKFLGALAHRYGFFRYWTEHAEIDPLWFFDPVLCAVHDSQLAQRNREQNRAILEKSLNTDPTLTWVVPPDLRTSEQHRREFLAWTPGAGLPQPLGWTSYQALGQPNPVTC